jgi:predicted amidophosphoribosyltransferase
VSIQLEGPWDGGLAYDVHTLSSTYLGPDESGRDQFDNVRSEMGELVYQLKYRRDRAILPEIVDKLDKVKGIEKFDAIIPIPPTNKGRAFQPVTEIANALGARRGVPVLTDVLTKQGGRELKNVDDLGERAKLLEESFAIDNAAKVTGKKVLLVDDLYRSGATLAEATKKLRAAGATYVGVLTMTKTRSRR